MCVWYPVCPMKKAYEQKIIPKHWIDDYCLSETNWKDCVRYQMEEAGKFHPDNMLPDGSLIKN